MAPLPEALIEAHRFTGYALVFGLTPLALIFQQRHGLHRALGLAYVAVMSLQYFSGLPMTLRHADDPSVMWRNLAFNFLGYWFVILAWRSIWRWRHAAPASGLDHALGGMLFPPAALLLAFGIAGHFPSTVLGLLGLWLARMDHLELRREPPARPGPPLLLRRHLRYMWASYCYVLTVLTLVHLRDVLPRDLRWLWPTLIGTPLVIWILAGGVHWSQRQQQAARLLVGIALALGVYVAATRP